MEGVLAVVFHNGFHNDVTCTAHAAADDEYVGVYGAADEAQGTAQIFPEAVHDLQCHVFAVTGKVAYILGGELVHGAQCGGGVAVCQHTLCQTDDAVCGGVLLQTAVLATVALHGLGGLYGDVTQLARTAVLACHDLAVYDDAAADPRAKGEHDGTVIALAAALPQLAQGRHVGIVACGYLGDRGEQLVHAFPEVEHAPAQIDALVDGVVAVHGTGYADADALYVSGGDVLFAELCGNGCGHIGQHSLAAVVGDGGDLPFVHKGAVRGEQTQLDGGAADINAECVRFHGASLLCSVWFHGTILGDCDGNVNSKGIGNVGANSVRLFFGLMQSGRTMFAPTDAA